MKSLGRGMRELSGAVELFLVSFGVVASGCTSGRTHRIDRRSVYFPVRRFTSMEETTQIFFIQQILFLSPQIFLSFGIHKTTEIP